MSLIRTFATSAALRLGRKAGISGFHSVFVCRSSAPTDKGAVLAFQVGFFALEVSPLVQHHLYQATLSPQSLISIDFCLSRHPL